MPRRLPRTLPAALLTGAVLAAGTVSAPASAPASAHAAAPPRAAAAGPCKSAADPQAARRLGNGITAALRGRTGTESVAVYDRKRGITCWVGSSRHYDSASVVKATILGALLRKVVDQKRKMTANEKSLAHKMITRSDNAAASSLWKSVGRTRMQRFLAQANMRQTKLGPGGYWGLTQITAYDQIQLLSRLTKPSALLPDKARAYALGLMNSVVSSQRWGTPTGRPAGAKWHVKNGWLPRHGKYWRVHSIGAFTGRGHDYMIVVLTQDTPSMGYGVTSIERVAGAVHRGLNPGTRSMTSQSVPDATWEVSDGSVPPNV
ncbi:serine hydrolase [Spirillospora sp. NPDC050679]